MLEDGTGVRPVARRGYASAVVVALFCLVSVLAGRANDAWGVAGASAPVCIANGVCATASDRPDAVAASSATKVRLVGEDSSLTNGSGNELSQVAFSEAIPDGFTFVEDALGACTATSATVTCRHGLLGDGQTVSNTLVFQTPVLSPGTQQTSTFAGTWCWDGCQAHNPGAARVDSIDVSEATTVVARLGFDATYLLAGTDGDLATGAAVSDTDTLVGRWTIPRQASDLAATATEKPNPPGFQACPADGQLCRKGSWFGALSPGTTGFSPYSSVVYTQSSSLIPSGTTASNYAVVYTHCLPGDDPAHPDGCPVVRLPRCVSATDLRCTEFVTKLPGGSFRVGVRIGSQNGYMQ